jgi:hypothetical protein
MPKLQNFAAKGPIEEVILLAQADPGVRNDANFPLVRPVF